MGKVKWMMLAFALTMSAITNHYSGPINAMAVMIGALFGFGAGFFAALEMRARA